MDKIVFWKAGGLTLIDMDTAFNQKAKIAVIGVGGGGNNAVDRMIQDGVEGIDFIAVNTDSQVLKRSRASVCLQLGEKLTGGLGAGGVPDIGRKAAEETRDEVAQAINGVDMIFVTAGMGGGTGTGAAPVIADIAKKMGILTIGVVTKPFNFEGRKRMRNAVEGIDELRKSVDTLIVVPNQKLLETVSKEMSLEDALKKADEVLSQGVRGIADLISNPGIMNVDFADVQSTMKEKGVAHMGIARASGKNKAEDAVEMAIKSPLLETSINGAQNVLICVAGGHDLTLMEVAAASDIVTNAVDGDANIIFGSSINDDLDDEVVITVIATGFERISSVSSIARDAAPADANAQQTEQNAVRQEPAARPLKKIGEMFGDDDDNDGPTIQIPTFLQKKNKGN